MPRPFAGEVSIRRAHRIYNAVDAQDIDVASVGYAKGVPMGGDLTAAPDGLAHGWQPTNVGPETLEHSAKFLKMDNTRASQ